MTIERPYIISFEGLDGSFKETNTNAAFEYLNEKGQKVAKFDFPQYQSESSYFVRQFLSGKYNVDKLTPENIALFYAIDRYDTYNQKIKPIMQDPSYDFIIFDRWISSNMFYQCARSDDPEKVYKNICHMEYDNFNLPREDFMFWMSTCRPLAQKIIKANRASLDINETNDEFLDKVDALSGTIINWIARDDIPISTIKTIDHSTERFLDKDAIFKQISNTLDCFILQRDYLKERGNA